MTTALPVVYLAAGEGKRLRPLTDDCPKAMIEIGGLPLGERALRSLRDAGTGDVVAVLGHHAETLRSLGSQLADERLNPCFAELGNVYSLWCARDVVANGCFIVNSDVMFEPEIARRLVASEGSAVLCARDHGVDAESMKAVACNGRLERLSKDAPIGSNSEYIGLARVDREHGPLLAEILDQMVARGDTAVYYEDALQLLAEQVPVGVVAVDGLAWIEIDDHEDFARAGGEILARLG